MTTPKHLGWVGWLIAAMFVAGLMVSSSIFLGVGASDAVGNMSFAVGMLAVPLGVGIGVLRYRYDAANTLEALSASLCGEDGLARLNEHLLGVVEEAMRPAHASLLLRSPTYTSPRRRAHEEGSLL